ncbi:MAG TPA: sialidase family protein [Candidatus Limnocylindria bacterium]|nr:sialidase family protein [Candidatus Limnocylindria bacterium]
MSVHVDRQLERGASLSTRDERHLASCPRCSAVARRLAKLDEELRVVALPLAAASMPERLFEASSQRRRAFAAVIPVAALVVLLAAAIGVGLGSGFALASPTASPIVGSSASATPSSASTPTPGATPPLTAPIAAEDPGLIAGPASCSNGTSGFSVDVPYGWYANAAIAGAPACARFAPVPFDPGGRAGSGFIAVRADAFAGGLGGAEAVLEAKQVAERVALTVADQPAVRIRWQDGVGEHLAYLIALDGASALERSTSFLVVRTLRSGAVFASDSTALTQMMGTLRRFPPLTDPGVLATAGELFARTSGCASSRYSLRYPASWQMLGSDCVAFAPSSVPGPAGAAITMGVIDGAIGYTTPVIGQEQSVISGHRARREAIAAAPAGWGGPATPESYRYVVQLRGASTSDAETGPFLVASTSRTSSGDYELNKAVLDRIIATLQLADGDASALLVERTPPDGVVAAALADADGLLLGGQVCTAGSDCQPAIWRAAGDLSWNAPLRLTSGGSNAVIGLARGAAGWVAASGDAIWFSADGERWVKASGVTGDGLADGGPGYGAEGGCCGAEVEAVASTRTGLVAVGGVTCFKCAGRAAVWRSADGQVWSRLSYQAAFEGAAMRAVATLSSGRIVAGGGDRVWVSDDDGRTWAPHLPFRSDSISAMLHLHDDRLLAITTSAATGALETWESADGVQWEAATLSVLSGAQLLAAAEVDGSVYLSAQIGRAPATIRFALYRLTSLGDLQQISVEGGDAAAISSIAALDGRLVCFGRLTQGAHETPALWVGR